MSLFELILVYIISWWLALFMVLPWGVRMAATPGAGHAPSAPVKPNLRKKFIVTSLLAFVGPLIGLGISAARAEPAGIYHAGSNDCAQPADMAADASINATDSNATLGGPANMGQVPTFLDAPASDYTANRAIAERAPFSTVQMGVATTDTATGETRINGQPITASGNKPAHCP
jgi:predicted secreted protein